MKKVDEAKVASLVRQLLVELGEDPEREGLAKTPARVARAMAFLTRGYRETPRKAVGGAVLLGLSTFGAGAALHLSALRQLGPARSEGYFALAPFVGTLISWSLFGFELEPLFFGGLALMALGVWLAMDDNVFHEDVFSTLDQERMALYAGDAHAFDGNRSHKLTAR